MTHPFAVDGAAKPVAVKRSKAPLFLAGAVALALAVGVGAFAAYQMVFGGPSPAERMPASVVAFASVDLAAGLDQTRKLMRLAEKFPQAGNSSDPQESIKSLLRPGMREATDELSGWLGKRIGAGAWIHSNGQMYGLASVESTNDPVAQAQLTRLKEKSNGHMGFVVRDGFALLAFGDKRAQAAAESADAEAARAPLSKSARYTQARAWLEDDQIALIYVDLNAAAQILRDTLGKGPDVPAPKQYQGQIIAGLRAEDDAIVARYRTFGASPDTATLTDALARLGGLTGNAEVAAVARIPDDFGVLALFGRTSLLRPLLMPGPTIADDPFGTPFEPPVYMAPLTDAQKQELLNLLSKPNPTPAEKARIEELLGAELIDRPPGFTLPGEPVTITPPEPPLDLAELGKMLSGATIQVAVTGDGAHVVAQLRSKATDEQLGKLRRSIEGDAQVNASATDSTVTLTTKNFAPAGRKLSDDSTFKAAFAGLPTNGRLAVYLQGKVLPDQVRAVAIVQGVQDGQQTGMIRVLIR